MSKKDQPAEGGAVELRPEPKPDAPAELKIDAPPAPPAAPLSAILPDGKATPEEHAIACGHIDAKVKEGERRPLSKSQGFIFAAVKTHCGWGVQRAIDERITRAEYEEAVAEAMGTTLGGGVERPALKWRHDVRGTRKEG